MIIRRRANDYRDETVNHIRECSKLAQKEYKNRHNWVGKVIPWKLCKRLMVSDQVIPVRRPNTMLISKKRTWPPVYFAVSSDQRVKMKESKKIDKYLDHRELKKLWNMKVTVMPIVVGALGTSSKDLTRKKNCCHFNKKKNTS